VDIVETVKVIDFLIDRLPDVGDGEEAQFARLEALEVENEAAGKELDAAIRESEELFARVQGVVKGIVDNQI
jgi:hypothetical protein